MATATSSSSSSTSSDCFLVSYLLGKWKLVTSTVETSPLRYSNSLLEIIEDPYEIAEPGSQFLRFLPVNTTDETATVPTSIFVNLLLHIHKLGNLRLDHETDGLSDVYCHKLQRQHTNVGNDGMNTNSCTKNKNKGKYHDEDAVVLVVPPTPSLMEAMINSPVGTYIDESQTLQFNVRYNGLHAKIVMIIESNNIMKVEIHTSLFPTSKPDDDGMIEMEVKQDIKEVGTMLRIAESY